MRWVIGIATGVVIAITAWAAAVQHSGTTATTASAPARISPSGSAAPTAEPSTSTDALKSLSVDGRYSIAMVDLDTDQSLTYGNGRFDTASIVKVNILAALLHQSQRKGVELTSSQDSLARDMIQTSHNSSAIALFSQIGGKVGLDDFNDLLGLNDTDVGTDGNWGLTRTTADDQITVMRAVFGADSVLTTRSQKYIRGLMSNVIDSQRFGVPAIDDDALVKVGYMQRSATGLWNVNSIGLAQADGHTFLVALLSENNPTMQDGIALTNKVVAAAADGFD